MGGEYADVAAEVSVYVSVYCQECGEGLTITKIKGDKDGNIDVEVELHKCEEEEAEEECTK